MEYIYEYIDQNRDRFVQELLPLIAQPSISATGEGMEDFAKMMVEVIAEAGFQAELLPVPGGPPCIYCEVSSPLSDRTIMLIDHYDVVPPGRLEDWKYPPFKPVIQDNRIWGRGAGDCKGQFFTYLKALEAWRAVNGELPVRVRMVLIGDDEIGAPSLHTLLKTHTERLKADAMFCADASTLDVWGPVVILGLRGVLAINLVAHGAAYEAHSSSYGALLRNPAIRLAHAIAVLRGEDGRILVPGFYDDLKPLGEVEQHLLANLKVDKEAKLSSLGAAEFWGDPGHEYFETQQYRPTFNIHGLICGYTGEGWTAVVPTVATAKIDINLVPNLDPDDLLAKMRNHLDNCGFHDVEIQEITRNSYHCWAQPGGSFLGVVSQALKRVWGLEPVLYPSIGGGGPGAVIFKELVGNENYILVPLGQPDMNEHSPRESLDIDWFIRGIKVIATTIDEFAKSAIGREGDHDH